jgi:hypothetical protein
MTETESAASTEMSVYEKLRRTAHNEVLRALHQLHADMRQVRTTVDPRHFADKPVMRVVISIDIDLNAPLE